MIDLFGLHKEMDPREPAETPRRPDSPDGAQRIWAVLLALDTVLVVGFAGGLARLSWMRRSQPPSAVTIPTKPSRALPKTAKAPAAELPSTLKAEPAAKAAPAPAEKAAPAPKPEISVKGPVGSPTVSAPDLPQHEAAPVGAPAQASGTSAPPSAGAKPKAVPTEFACRQAASAKSVRLKGPFLVRTGGYKAMVRGDDGVWRLTVSLLPGSYKYFCVADGKKSKLHTVTIP